MMAEVTQEEQKKYLEQAEEELAKVKVKIKRFLQIRGEEGGTAYPLEVFTLENLRILYERSGVKPVKLFEVSRDLVSLAEEIEDKICEFSPEPRAYQRKLEGTFFVVELNHYHYVPRKHAFRVIYNLRVASEAFCKRYFSSVYR